MGPVPPAPPSGPPPFIDGAFGTQALTRREHPREKSVAKKGRRLLRMGRLSFGRLDYFDSTEAGKAGLL
jgi:hypothetical protein